MKNPIFRDVVSVAGKESFFIRRKPTPAIVGEECEKLKSLPSKRTSAVQRIVPRNSLLKKNLENTTGTLS